jgi:hypothetical protein
VYPPCTSLRRKYPFQRFYRLMKSINCRLSMRCLGSSPARLTKTHVESVRSRPQHRQVPLFVLERKGWGSERNQRPCANRRWLPLDRLGVALVYFGIAGLSGKSSEPIQGEETRTRFVLRPYILQKARNIPSGSGEYCKRTQCETLVSTQPATLRLFSICLA